MKPIVQYQIEVAICMAAFTLFYLLLWRKETNFQFKRYLLLAIPLFSIIIPMINLNIDLKPEQESATIQYITYLPNQLELVYTPIIAKTETLSGWEIAFWILSFGAIIMCIRLLISYLRIMQIYHKSTLSPSGKFRVVDDQIHAFSFFNMVIINKYQANSEDKEYILAHEHAHKKQGHSWDILYLELIKMLHWFNPIIWLLSRESKKNLEYMADQAVTYKIDNPQHYQYAIVQHASQSGYQLLKTQFSKTNLKNRIIMMNQPNNHKITSWKLFAILPVLAILLMSFSIKIDNKEIQSGLIEIVPSLLDKQAKFDQSQTKPETLNSDAKKSPAIFPVVDSKSSYIKPVPDSTMSEIFTIVEDQPMPASGDLTIYMEDINRSIIYPKEAREKGIAGKVFVQFIVQKDGSLSDVKVVRGISEECDKEAVRVIKEGPDWIAGKQRGQKVNVRMILPVTFIADNKIMGTVMSEDRKPIAGANVVIKGTTTGTVTDTQGNFLLQVDEDHREIVISSLGYISQIKSIVPGTSYSVEMKFDPDNPPAPIVAETVDDDSGIKIRANGKDVIDPGKNPLYIVEGVEMENFDSNTLNPDDINSIQVIKDEKALKSFGEKGKNGVIMIDLKEGVEFRSQEKLSLDEENPPIIVIDGKEVPYKELKNIAPESIESIEVIKDQTILEPKYGERGKNGLIKIKLKPGVEFKPTGSINDFNENPPLIIVDGVETEYVMEDIGKKISPADIESISVLKDTSATNEYGDKGKNGVVIIKTRPINGNGPEQDKLPEYKKGVDSFYKSFQKNIKYPKDARENGVQGKVLISFTVNTEGEIENIKAEKTKYATLKEIVVVGYSSSAEETQAKNTSEDLEILEKEVIRTIEELDGFNPGSKDGLAVDVRMTLPVMFKLAK